MAHRRSITTISSTVTVSGATGSYVFQTLGTLLNICIIAPNGATYDMDITDQSSQGIAGLHSITGNLAMALGQQVEKMTP